MLISPQTSPISRLQQGRWGGVRQVGTVEPAGLAGICVCVWNFNDGGWLGMSAETSVLGAALLGRLGVLGETNEELIQGRRALISSSYFHITIRQPLFLLNERRRGLRGAGHKRQSCRCSPLGQKWEWWSSEPFNSSCSIAVLPAVVYPYYTIGCFFYSRSRSLHALVCALLCHHCQISLLASMSPKVLFFSFE